MPTAALLGLSSRSSISLSNLPRTRPTRRRLCSLVTKRLVAQMGEEYDVIICGGGIQSASIAYHLTLRGVKPLVVERTAVGAAASGKAGGFLARAWGDGGPTQALHRVSFDMHEALSKTLNLQSYRRIPTLSVRTSPGGAKRALEDPPAPWLDGGDLVSAGLMEGETAQVTPAELTEALMAAAVRNGATVRKGIVTGIDTVPGGAGGGDGDGGGARVVRAVRVDGEAVACKRVVVAMGPWSVQAEDWLGISVPLEGIKSASVVYRSEELKAAVSAQPFALFCGEDPRYGTHLEVYPRYNGEARILPASCCAPAFWRHAQREPSRSYSDQSLALFPVRCSKQPGDERP